MVQTRDTQETEKKKVLNLLCIMIDNKRKTIYYYYSCWWTWNILYRYSTHLKFYRFIPSNTDGALNRVTIKIKPTSSFKVNSNSLSNILIKIDFQLIDRIVKCFLGTPELFRLPHHYFFRHFLQLIKKISQINFPLEPLSLHSLYISTHFKSGLKKNWFYMRRRVS